MRKPSDAIVFGCVVVRRNVSIMMLGLSTHWITERSDEIAARARPDDFFWCWASGFCLSRWPLVIPRTLVTWTTLEGPANVKHGISSPITRGKGTMKLRLRRIWPIVGLAGAVGCNTVPLTTTLQPTALDYALKRARFDMNCPSATGSVLTSEDGSSPR